MFGRKQLLSTLTLAMLFSARVAVSRAQSIDITKLRQAADKGDLSAQYNLCYHYWKGEFGNPPDFRAAVDYCQRAAELGHPKAMAILGSMSRRGQGVRKDYKKAMQLLTVAANARVGRAAYELGMMFKLGEGTYPDQSQADAYFCDAVEWCDRPARTECSKTRLQFDGARMASMGLSSRRDRDCPDEDILKPDSKVVHGPEGGPLPVTQVVKAAAPEQVQRLSVAGEGDVDLDKAISLQSGPIPSSDVSRGPGAPSPAPVFAEAPERPRHTFPKILIIMVICLDLVYIAYRGYKRWADTAQCRIREDIRKALAGGLRASQQIADLYELYCRRGGKAGSFSGDELLVLEASLHVAGRSFTMLGLGLDKALDLAGKLAAPGMAARIERVLNEPLLLEAAAVGRADEVLTILGRSGGIEDFVAKFSGTGRPLDFHSAYAAGLARMDRVEPAFRMLPDKHLEQFSPAELILLLELHVKLGHFEAAGFLLERVTQAHPPATAKGYYEELSKQAAMRGGQRLAADLSLIAAGEPVQRPPTAAG